LQNYKSISLYHINIRLIPDYKHLSTRGCIAATNTTHGDGPSGNTRNGRNTITRRAPAADTQWPAPSDKCSHLSNEDGCESASDNEGGSEKGNGGHKNTSAEHDDVSAHHEDVRAHYEDVSAHHENVRAHQEDIGAELEDANGGHKDGSAGQGKDVRITIMLLYYILTLSFRSKTSVQRLQEDLISEGQSQAPKTK
jgi:hypothetical protein